MEATFLDEELYKYWSQLSISQKEAVINIIRSLPEPSKTINIEDYNRQLNEAMERVRNGEFYTQEEVEKMSNEW